MLTGKYNILVLLIFCVWMIGAFKTSAAEFEGEDWNKDVGWLDENCLAIKNPDIQQNSQFILVEFLSSSRVEQAEVVKKAESVDTCKPLFDDRADVNTAAGYYFYKIKSEKPIGMGIGLLNFKEEQIVDLVFSYCHTSEGINFFIHRGNALIWDEYYYLGYDVTPTCN